MFIDVLNKNYPECAKNFIPKTKIYSFWITSRETLGKYYYDLSKLAFATSVLGGGGFAFFGERSLEDRIINIVVGILMTVIFAVLGHRTIKMK